MATKKERGGRPGKRTVVGWAKLLLLGGYFRGFALGVEVFATRGGRKRAKKKGCFFP